MEWYNLVSFSGIFVLMGLAWVFSSHKRLINWRVIVWGLIFQLLFALFVFLVPAGTKMFLVLNNLVVAIMDSATEGAKFVFGRLAIPPGIVNSMGESSMGFFFAFQSLPTIIFFSALMSILYYVGIMSFIIRIFAYLFTKFMHISGAESLSAASNIFVGVESTLTIKPHLSEMTRSELCTVLTVGMATVSSNILAVYVFCLKDQFPAIAGHLISASFLSAPAALIMSKIILPESETPKTLGMHVHPHYEKERNVFEAVINGANAGVRLIVGIVALLIAVLGLVALIDLFLQFFGGKLNLLLGIQIDWSLKGLLGYLFYPLTIIIGVPVSDADVISKIIGERAIVTELTAYQDLADIIGKGVLLHPRSIIIATYALCGFAHIASLAIFMGSITALVPNRIHTFTQIGFRPLIASTLACLMTACVAGTFCTNTSLLLGK
ncbi:MAG: nucleoside transporter [Planctomycetes bacterium]|nr:nucleoside transporter [Planctomycetota bacterium]